MHQSESDNSLFSGVGGRCAVYKVIQNREIASKIDYSLRYIYVSSSLFLPLFLSFSRSAAIFHSSVFFSCSCALLLVLWLTHAALLLPFFIRRPSACRALPALFSRDCNTKLLPSPLPLSYISFINSFHKDVF